MTRDSTLTSQAEKDLAIITAVLPHVPRDRASLATWSTPGPAGQSDNGRSSNVVSSAPPGTFDRTLVEARKLRRNYDAAFSLLHDAAMTLLEIHRLATPTVGDPTLFADPGCPNCAKAATVDTHGQLVALWTRPYDTRTRLCRWCFDFHAAHGTRPSPELARLHHVEGVKVTTRLIVEHHPDLRARVGRATMVAANRGSATITTTDLALESRDLGERVPRP